MKILITFLFVFIQVLFPSHAAFAQEGTTDEQQIKEQIETLFDGMRANDGEAVRSVFAPNALMRTVVSDDMGNNSVREGDLQSFVSAVDRDKPEVWDERIHDIRIEMDGDLASVFTPYSFFRGEKFSHCGANSMQFVRLNGVWKIYFIIDTRRTTECSDQ